MKTSYPSLCTTFLCLLLPACAKVNSVHPFDDKQAAILIQQQYVAKPTQQMIAVTLPHPEQWKKIDKSRGTLGTPLLLIPQHESEHQWSESISTKISGYINTPQMTPLSFVRSEIAIAKENCKQVAVTLLSETAGAVTYRLDKTQCKNDKNEKQIGKAFNGRDAVYFLQYSAQNPQMSQAQFNKMSRVIQTARLVNNPHYQKA